MRYNTQALIAATGSLLLGALAGLVLWVAGMSVRGTWLMAIVTTAGCDGCIYMMGGLLFGALLARPTPESVTNRYLEILQRMKKEAPHVRAC